MYLSSLDKRKKEKKEKKNVVVIQKICLPSFCFVSCILIMQFAVFPPFTFVKHVFLVSSSCYAGVGGVDCVGTQAVCVLFGTRSDIVAQQWRGHTLFSLILLAESTWNWNWQLSTDSAGSLKAGD